MLGFLGKLLGSLMRTLPVLVSLGAVIVAVLALLQARDAQRSAEKASVAQSLPVLYTEGVVTFATSSLARNVDPGSASVFEQLKRRDVRAVATPFGSDSGSKPPELSGFYAGRHERGAYAWLLVEDANGVCTQLREVTLSGTVGSPGPGPRSPSRDVANIYQPSNEQPLCPKSGLLIPLFRFAVDTSRTLPEAADELARSARITKCSITYATQTYSLDHQDDCRSAFALRPTLG